MLWYFLATNAKDRKRLEFVSFTHNIVTMIIIMLLSIILHQKSTMHYP